MMKHCFVLLLLVLISGCVGPIPGLYPPESKDNNIRIFVVNHGWHTGIIVNRKLAGPFLPALAQYYENSNYLEIGWGDADFYQSNGSNWSHGFKALFWPTDSVLHVVGFNRNPKLRFFFNDLIELKISAEGFKQLVTFINDSFQLDAHQKPQMISGGLYGDSRFFKSPYTYHLFYTCNNWTAEAVRQTGFPISSFYALTAGNVMYQLQQ